MTLQQRNHKKTKAWTLEQPAKSGYRPCFSIILCTYNRSTQVLSTLASLRRQTLPYPQFEVIVVDNHSSDGTFEAIKNYLKAGASNKRTAEQIWNVRCLAQKHNDLTQARQLGLEAAKGEIAVFIDDDAVADPHFLARLLMAYTETGADAIGGRVELRWETPRPHWLKDELLPYLGHFSPALERFPLQPPAGLSNSNFSVKIEMLRSLGNFSSLLSKKAQAPLALQIDELCQRLHQAGCKVWYEPEAIVVRRSNSGRLQRPYFVGKAYWNGRSHVLLEYEQQIKQGVSSLHQQQRELQQCFRDLLSWAYLFFIQLPLQNLAREHHSELLLAAMARAELWGRFLQRLQLLQHSPQTIATEHPPVLFVHSGTFDLTSNPLMRAMIAQGIICMPVRANLPLLWLWQHRAYRKDPIGIIHFYRAGAFNLTYLQRLNLLLRLWLARRLRIRIVATDTGGWWQSAGGLRFRTRRIFERSILLQSDTVITNSRHPEQVYPDKQLQQRVHFLAHPGYRGYYSKPMTREQAHRKLGLTEKSGCVFLCLTYAHTEQEILYLIEVFNEMCQRIQQLHTDPVYLLQPQLLLVGAPGDVPVSKRILERGARLKNVHLFLGQTRKEDIPLYMGATNVVILPHQATYQAGSLEETLLALSYERSIIAPNLPRFRDILPPQAVLTYVPTNRETLIHACINIQTRAYRLNPEEVQKIEARSGWQQYGLHLLKLYRILLSKNPGSRT